MQLKEALVTSLIIAGCLLLSISAKAVQKQFCDEKDDGLYPDPTNCSTYISCANQITYQMPCPSNLIFDPSLNVCNWRNDVSKERKIECSSIGASTNPPPSTRQPTTIKTSSTTKTTTTETKTTTDHGPKKEHNKTNPMPQSVEMRFDMGSKSVALNVTRKPDTSPRPPRVITAERGRITEWETNETYASYENENKSASLVVSTNEKNGKGLKYQGSFYLDGKRYALKQEGAMNIVPATRKDQHITYNGTKYVIAEEDSLPPTCSGPLAARDSSGDDTTARSPTLQDVVLRAESPPTNSNTKQHYGVELLIVIDYATYYKFYMQSTATTEQGKKTDAIVNLRYYFAHVVDGIDDRYSSVNEPDFDMYVRLAGYYIATTPYDSPWTEGYGIKVDGYTDAGKALYSFESWMQDNAALLPNFDSATIFSSNRLFYGYRSDGSKYTISGLGEIEGTCTYRKVSINYEFGQYSTIETAAHELGHNLGAQHDDPYYNGCDSAQQFVMAGYPAQLTNDTFKNPFRFSQCSVAYFRRYAAILDSMSNNCLLNAAYNVESGDFNASLKVWPGQKYKPDQQCQLIYGSKNSYYCAGGTRDRGICREMQCLNPTTYKCEATVEQRAFDGTTCADGSWCYAGECVKNDMAPNAPQSCIYGDYRGTYNIDGRDYTCPQIGDYYPWRCYDSGFSGDCCLTCNAKKNAANIGCEYGDREPAWCRSALRSFDCYDPSVRNRCCSTCSQYLTNITGCEYGDRDKSWCPNVSAEQCYTSSSTCCASCRRFYKGYPGCEYGDRVTGCGQYVSYCQTEPSIAASCCGTCLAAYPPTSTTTTTTAATTKTTMTTTMPPTFPQNSTCPLGDGASYCSTMPVLDCYGYSGVCCDTCPKHYNASRPGCEYGDQVPWCSTYVQGPAECQRPEVAKYCCETCPRVLQGSLEPACLDKADWCVGLSPGYCYDKQTQNTCCATCKSYEKSQPNCKYGDMFTWCAPQYCDSNRAECCTSCQ